MPTYQKRGEAWRAIVRKKGFPPRSMTFPTKGMAKVWAERIEREMAARSASGASDADSLTLGALIEWYMAHMRGLAPWGRSKEADLLRLTTYPISELVASELRQQDFVGHAMLRRKTAGPATVLNDFVWLRQVLRAGKAHRGLHAPLQALADALEYMRAHRVVAKPRQRDRRLKDDEEKRLLAYFDQRPGEIPMGDVVRFALLSTRRQEEITRIKRADLDRKHSTGWLDDVKHPRTKVGNRREFRLLREAWDVIDRQPKGELLFPYEPKSIGAAFTRACKLLGIKDLTFHDLRHEATSRLFERGYQIHEVAQFTLHESWATLRRYTHLNPKGVVERG